MDVARPGGGGHRRAKGPLLAVGAAASALSFIAATQTRRFRLLGALVGALSVQVLLRQGNVGFHARVGAHRAHRGPAGVGLGLPALSVTGPAPMRDRRRRHGRPVRGCDDGLRPGHAAGSTDPRGRGPPCQGGAGRRPQRPGGATEQELSKAGSALAHSSSLTGAWWARAARAVPVVGHQAEAVELVTAEARRVVRSAQLPASLGELDRLKYQSGRFDMQRISRLQRPIADSAATLIAADGHLSA